MRMKTEPEGEQYGEVNKREKSNGGNGMQTRGFNCRWTQRSGVGMGEEGVYIYEYICVCGCTHAIAKSWDDHDCSAHANEGSGKYSDG